MSTGALIDANGGMIIDDSGGAQLSSNASDCVCCNGSSPACVYPACYTVCLTVPPFTYYSAFWASIGYPKTNHFPGRTVCATITGNGPAGEKYFTGPAYFGGTGYGSAESGDGITVAASTPESGTLCIAFTGIYGGEYYPDGVGPEGSDGAVAFAHTVYMPVNSSTGIVGIFNVGIGITSSPNPTAGDVYNGTFTGENYNLQGGTLVVTADPTCASATNPCNTSCGSLATSYTVNGTAYIGTVSSGVLTETSYGPIGPVTITQTSAGACTYQSSYISWGTSGRSGNIMVALNMDGPGCPWVTTYGFDYSGSGQSAINAKKTGTSPVGSYLDPQNLTTLADGQYNYIRGEVIS